MNHGPMPIYDRTMGSGKLFFISFYWLLLWVVICFKCKQDIEFLRLDFI